MASELPCLSFPPHPRAALQGTRADTKKRIKSGYDHWSYSFHFKLRVSRNHTLYIQPVAQSVKNLPAVQDTRTCSLGQEDPLETGMTTYSSILAWKMLWPEEPGGLQPMGSQESDPMVRLKD